METPKPQKEHLWLQRLVGEWTFETEEVVITRHGKPAGLLIGFASEDDWREYQLEHDPRFLQRIERARKSLRAGRGVKLADVPV